MYQKNMECLYRHRKRQIPAFEDGRQEGEKIKNVTSVFEK